MHSRSPSGETLGALERREGPPAKHSALHGTRNGRARVGCEGLLIPSSIILGVLRFAFGPCNDANRSITTPFSCVGMHHTCHLNWRFLQEFPTECSRFMSTQLRPRPPAAPLGQKIAKFLLMPVCLCSNVFSVQILTKTLAYNCLLPLPPSLPPSLPSSHPASFRFGGESEQEDKDLCG